MWKLDLFMKPWHMQISCLYIWAYGQIYFNVLKKIQVLVGNQRVITAFAGLKGMQSWN